MVKITLWLDTNDIDRFFKGFYGKKLTEIILSRLCLRWAHAIVEDGNYDA